MKISELYGKKVESTAGKSGYVVSCNGAAGKLVCLLCADEEENEAGKYLGNLSDLDFNGTKIQRAKIGKRNYPAEKLFMGDVIIVPEVKRLKSDVIKDGKVILKKGAEVNPQLLSTAAAEGEFVQTNLKTI